MRSLILLAVALLILANACAQSVNDAPGSEALTALLPGVPDTRQSTEYSCGAAALQAVLSYWGRDVGEEDLRELLNTDPESGTYPEDILRVASELGLEAEYRENSTLEEIETSVSQGVPVIVDCQAWRSPASGNVSWADDWVDGHWMVIIGLDDENVYFEDPYILGRRGFMSRQEFEERWHNPRGWDESDTVKQIHLGIFIRGENSTTIRPFRHVD
ncbi:MAG TPA: C39 family peptidase [Methanotrichaceae archaeon]|nr:C39 family peptidase [Methanotrichaceae archaeon]